MARIIELRGEACRYCAGHGDSSAPNMSHDAAWRALSACVAGSAHVELHEFADGTGRGLRATRDFAAGEVIMSVPTASCLSVEMALREPRLGAALAGKALRNEDMLAVYIMYLRSMLVDAKDDDADPVSRLRRAHMALLPAAYTSSMFFSDAELHVCRGSSLHTMTLQLREQIEDDYTALVRTLFVPHLDLFPLPVFTRAAYMYALATVQSRGMDFEAPPYRVVCPLLDLVNHSSAVDTCHALDPVQQCVSVLAGAPVAAGDQVFINYGRVGNARLLRLYGFVLPDNAHSSYELVLTTHPHAPLFNAKLAAWRRIGLCAQDDARAAAYGLCTVSLTRANPLPLAALQYLRVQRATSDDELASGGDFTQPIDANNEATVRGALDEAFASLLAAYAPDEELAAVPRASGNAWAAALVAAEEKQILRAALAAVRAKRD